MTGYENIRRMSDEELTEYFKKFAKHYYHLGEVDTIYDKQKDDISLDEMS